MFKKFLITPFFLLLGYFILASHDFKIIAAGIAIFIVGMCFMEDGFKLFTGGALEKILKKTTDTVPRAIFSGFFSTALVQSSSLISVIAISFLSAELLSLSQAIGIIFGANIGSTTTAWIIASFGVKIKISYYAMPMLIFGVIFSFFKDKPYKGLGYFLMGLGFIFLGIGYMKEGFETLKDGINLAKFAMDGYLGIAVYVLVGAIATVIIQSSGATMAIILTAVASGQINYLNAISLAIGANLGTTITAIIGSLTSNADGKRLAVAHLIFNAITAVAAILFIYPLKEIVDQLSIHFGINAEDYAMKLSLFHTIFNIAGVLLVTPFMGRLVKFLNKLFIFKGEKRGKPIYLDEEVIKTPGPALLVLHKETEHLYDSVSHLTIQALRLHRHEVWSKTDLRKVIKTVKAESVDINQVYADRIKYLYSEIIRFAIMAARYMNAEEREKVYQIKIANRNIIEIFKDIRELEKNITVYMKSRNEDIKNEYNYLREEIADLIRCIDIIRNDPENASAIETIERIRADIPQFDLVKSQRISELLMDEKIDHRMASSLMNDSSFTRSIAKKLLEVAAFLWTKESEENSDQEVPDISLDIEGALPSI